MFRLFVAESEPKDLFQEKMRNTQLHPSGMGQLLKYYNFLTRKIKHFFRIDV